MEARKNDAEKPRFDLLSPSLLEDTARVMAFGARKYGDRNYLNGAGLRFGRVFAALMRHLWAWWRGEDSDEETGISHLAHAACNLMMLYDLVERGGQDDRPSRKTT